MEKGELEKFLISEGYTHLKYVEGWGWCGLRRFIFTTGLCVGLGEQNLLFRYCYKNFADAAIALVSWDGKDNPPDEYWIKRKGIGGDYRNEKHKDFNPKWDKKDNIDHIFNKPE